MIESVAELEYQPTEEDAELTPEELAAKKFEHLQNSLRDMLGITLEQITDALCQSIKERADELALDFVSVAPYNDYGKLMDETPAIAGFLKLEASKPSTWNLKLIEDVANNIKLLKFKFLSSAVDDGKSLAGFVFVSKAGQVVHAFGQNDS